MNHDAAKAKKLRQGEKRTVVVGSREEDGGDCVVCLHEKGRPTPLSFEGHSQGEMEEGTPDYIWKARLWMKKKKRQTVVERKGEQKGQRGFPKKESGPLNCKYKLWSWVADAVRVRLPTVEGWGGIRKSPYNNCAGDGVRRER